MMTTKSITTDNGFIQLHRKLLEWEWYTDTNTKALFIHILLKANHKDKNWRGINIKRGSFITSVNTLSLETGLSIKNIRTALKHLEETKEVARSTSSINTIITVLNYDNYQSGGKVVASELANKGQGSGKVVATTNNENNENNENNKQPADQASFNFETYFSAFKNAKHRTAKSQAKNLFTGLTIRDAKLALEVSQSEEFRNYLEDKGEFATYPHNWLKEEGWKNDYSGYKKQPVVKKKSFLDKMAEMEG